MISTKEILTILGKVVARIISSIFLVGCYLYFYDGILQRTQGKEGTVDMMNFYLDSSDYFYIGILLVLTSLLATFMFYKRYRVRVFSIAVVILIIVSFFERILLMLPE